MAGNIKGIIVEIGGDTSGLQKALKSVNSATSSLSKELRGVNSLLKLDPTNTELVAQKQTLLSKNIEETSEKLKLLKSIQEQADSAIANGTQVSEENYRALQREIANTENKLKTLQSQSSKWSTAGKAIEEFGNKITNVSDKVDKLGNTLTASLTVPIVGLGTAAVTTGNSFEAQMSRVQAIAGATKDELEQLTNQAIQLGAETSFSATEVAAGMENLASAGFTTNEIMEAMPGLLDLAASSGAELATSSEIAASAIRGFGLEASEAGHVADVFAEAAARTNAQTEDMGEAMKYVAPVAKTVGLSIEETAAAIGIMSDAGIKGSQAGTTLRSGLTRIIKPTKQVKEAMEELGVEFYDNNGTMKSLTEIIDDLQKSTKDLSDETKNQALAQIFGTEALSGMLALVNRGADDLDDMTKSFKKADGAAEDMADTMLDNTAGSLESLSGSIESAGIAIQKALSPEIRDLSKWIQDLVDDFTNLSEEEQLNIIKTVALVAGIGPLVKILGTTGKTLGTVTQGIGIFSQAIGVATGKTTSNVTSVNNLAKALSALTSPVGLITTGLTAAAIAAIYFATKQTEAQKAAEELAKETENLKQNYDEFNKSIDDATNSDLAQIDAVNRLREELKTLVDENGKVKEGYESRVSFILNELNKALGTEYELNGNIIDSYKELQNEIDSTIEKKRAEIILNSEEQKYAEAIEQEKEAVEELKNITDQLGMSYAEARKKVDDYYSAQKKMLGYGEKLTEDESSIIKQYTDQEIKALDNLIQAYGNTESVLQGSVENQKQYMTDYALFTEGKYDEIGRTITATMQESTNISLEELKNNILIQKENLDTYKKMYQQYGSEVALELQQQAQSNLDSLAKELVSRTQTVNTLGEQEVLAWKTLAESSYDIYSQYVSQMAPEMQEKIQEATGVIIANTPEFAKQAGIMGEKVVAEFDKNAEAKKEALDTLQGYYEGLNDKEKNELLKKTVGDKAEEVAKQFEKGDYETSGKNVLEGIYDGLNNRTLGQTLINKAAGIARSIANQFNIQWDEHSPSKLMKKKTEYLLEPIGTVFSKEENQLINDAKNLAKSIISSFDSSFKLNEKLNIPSVNSMKYANALNNNVIHESKNIFTTPQIVFNVQELDEAKLEQCFNYINRKFGTQY